jgi:hypothetical protein
MTSKGEAMRVLICVVLTLLVLTVPVAAFGPGGGPGGGGFGPGPAPDLWGDLEFKPVVGHWAEYRMAPSDEKPLVMRFAVVGKEDDAFWYETTITPEEGDRIISKMLISGSPDDTEGTKRMIMKAGDEPAMEMPMQMMQMMGDMDMGTMGKEEEEESAPEPEMSDLGVESITVPAGTFDAHHYQFSSEEDTFDAWLAPGVGPYGVVKSVAADFEMTLMGFGDDATSQITEEPQQLPMRGFPMGGPGGGMGQ